VTAAEIRAELVRAERAEQEALDRYELHPSQEARWEWEREAKSVRWWAIQAAQVGT
jgi:hypothetical protein